MSERPTRTALVTGGAGFIGCNLAAHLVEKGWRVRVLDSLARPGVECNLEWLTRSCGDRVEPISGDVRDAGQMDSAIRGVNAVFHLAAQVAVTTSLEDPREDLETNVLGTFNVLEAVRRRRPKAPVIFASTNKVYGGLEDVALRLSEQGYAPVSAELARHGISERRPLDFHTPYGCSKGAADQYVLDYARSYGVRAGVLRMSCIYGEHQMGTEDQGWVAHFVIRALAGEPITLYGDGEQVRDVCDVADTCAAYIALLERIDSLSGQVLNWGGGPANAVSLLTVIGEIGSIIGRTPRIQFADWRPGDQRWFVADTRAVDAALGLGPRKPWRRGLRELVHSLTAQGANRSAPAPLPIQPTVAL
jgi:CDP-paratose 2-epimerase